MLEDVTSVALHSALDSLATRQRVIADNIANVDTPHFTAGRVSFEDALRAAVADGSDPAEVSPVTARSLEPTRLDGNNVNLDTETVSAVDTNLRYQMVLHAYDNKINGIRTVIKGV